MSRLTGEFDRVGVAGVEDYLDQVDALTPLNLKLETVPDIDEGVSTEKSQGVAAVCQDKRSGPGTGLGGGGFFEGRLILPEAGQEAPPSVRRCLALELDSLV